jgi:hypothetical protein
MMSKIYTGMFRKKNDQLRHMTFIKLEDIPEKFLESKMKGDQQERRMSDGMELVWDLDHANFRVFNWKSTVGTIKEMDLPDDEKSKLFS